MVSRMSVKDLFDCQSCGACCHNHLSNVRQGLDDYDEVNVRSPLLEDDEIAHKYTFVRKGKHYMRMVSDKPRCIALEGTVGERVGCTVYSQRPSICRQFEAASEGCLKSRREQKIPLPAGVVVSRHGRSSNRVRR